MTPLPQDITHFFTGNGGGIALLIVVLIALFLLVLWARMLFDALRAGSYLWAIFILVGPIVVALLYYFTVYSSAQAKRGALVRIFAAISWFVILPLLCVAIPAMWIVLDGLHDSFDHADVALVPGYGESKDGGLGVAVQARLDRATALYRDGKFPFIIVSGQTAPEQTDEAEAMAGYLKAHGVPASVIIQDTRGEKAGETIENLTRIMQGQGFHSVLVINDYYRLARENLVFRYAGVREIEQAHVGEWKREDIPVILGEVVGTYDRLSKTYLLPVAQIVYKTVMNSREDIGKDVEGGKNSINKGLDSMSK